MKRIVPVAVRTSDPVADMICYRSVADGNLLDIDGSKIVFHLY